MGVYLHPIRMGVYLHPIRMGGLKRYSMSGFIFICTAILLYSDLAVCQRNIAQGRPALQSSTYRPSQSEVMRDWRRDLDASLAVDGLPAVCGELKYNDGNFSHTMTKQSQWWTVDLGRSYYIYRMALCNRGEPLNNRLRGLYILSSEDTNTYPNRNANTDWVERSNRRDSYGDYEDVVFDDAPVAFLARHVAVYNRWTDGVTLREVEINGFSQTDIEKVRTQTRVSEFPQPKSITIDVTISGFDPLTFVNAFIVIERITPDRNLRIRRQEISNNDTYTVTDPNLEPSTPYSYKVRIISHGIELYKRTWITGTLVFPCRKPGDITVVKLETSLQAEKRNGQTYIKTRAEWRRPTSGCYDSDANLNYLVLINGRQVEYPVLTTRRIVAVTIYDLLPFAHYNITIIGRNEQNISVSTTEMLRTTQAAPDDPPGGVTLHTYNTSCLLLKWKTSPQRPNGNITQYEVDCHVWPILKEYPGESQSHSVVICGFPPGIRVHCRVYAVTRYQLIGVAKTVSALTGLKISVPKVDEDVSRGESGFFEIPFPKLNLTGINVTNYSVVVLSLDPSSRARRQTKKCSVEIDTSLAGPPAFSPLLSYEEAMACDLDYYLAAKLDKTVEPGYRFPVGDDKEYNGVRNVPVKDGASYNVYYGVDASLPGETTVIVQVLGDSVRSFTVTPSRQTTKKPEPKPLSKEVVNAIIAVISVVFVLIAAAIVTFLLIRKRRQLKKNASAPLRYDSTDNEYTEPEAPAVSIRPSSTLTPPSEMNGASKKSKSKKFRNIKGDYENCPSLPSPTREESEAIPVDKLKWYIESNQELILRQYEKLKDVPVGLTIAASLPENKSKCRYKDLYPVDSYRVLLRRLPSHGTDFINASYMPGYERDNKFIAAQGPTNVTIQDFWLMIWQQDVSSVVMATRTFETNKMKCVQYWPENVDEEQKVGDFRLLNTGVEKWPDFVITRLKVSTEIEERWLTHYQFLSWPDHDVPDTTQPFLTFYRKFSSQAAVKSGPILVHCSAGVGRSGTIIALDYLLGQAKAESTVDFYKCVVRLRERRPNMIQTQEQYVFVHRVLYDALSTENFLIRTDMFPGKKDDRVGLAKEFQYVEEVLSKTETITDSGKLAENLPLSRFPSILPDDKYRIYLNGRDGQTYINAIRVDGYRKVDQFYATQIPLESTVKDFWQLVHERACKVIIQLGDSDDKVKFYPSKSGTGYSYGSGTHTVTTKSCLEKGALQVYQLEHAIEKKNIMKDPRVYSETSELSLIKLPQKLCNRPLQPMHVIAMVEQIVRVIEKSGDINVLVTSSDGARLCGVFICSFNCLESIRLTQEVEVYSQVLIAKHRRSQFIGSFDEYKHIYQILEAYVDQFSQYQNVSCM